MGESFEKTLSIARSRHESMRSSESVTDSIEELEMPVEAYFVVIGSTLNKLTLLKEYIDDTEEFINIQLEKPAYAIELLLATATFVVAIFGVVAGIVGMSFTIPMLEDPGAFKWVLLIRDCHIFYLFVGFQVQKSDAPLDDVSIISHLVYFLCKQKENRK